MSHDRAEVLTFGTLILCALSGATAGGAVRFMHLRANAGSGIEALFIGAIVGIACMVPGAFCGAVAWLPCFGLIALTSIVQDSRP